MKCFSCQRVKSGEHGQFILVLFTFVLLVNSIVLCHGVEVEYQGTYDVSDLKTHVRQPRNTACLIRCFNGGTPSRNSKGNCACNCRIGHTGKKCQTPPSKPCRGDCINNGIPYWDYGSNGDKKRCRCECLYGYTGNKCQRTLTTKETTDGCTPIHECMCNENLICLPNRCCICEPWQICKHGSTTASINMETEKERCICDCLFGYKGTKCQTKMSRTDTGGCDPVFECKNHLKLACPGDTCCKCVQCPPEEPIRSAVRQWFSCPMVFEARCHQKNTTCNTVEIANKLELLTGYVYGCLNNFTLDGS